MEAVFELHVCVGSGESRAVQSLRGDGTAAFLMEGMMDARAPCGLRQKASAVLVDLAAVSLAGLKHLASASPPCQSDEWKLSAAAFALAYTLPGSCLDSHLISHVYREPAAGPVATRKSSYVTGLLAGGRRSD